jgi:hypothetical protein
MSLSEQTYFKISQKYAMRAAKWVFSKRQSIFITPSGEGTRRLGHSSLAFRQSNSASTLPRKVTLSVSQVQNKQTAMSEKLEHFYYKQKYFTNAVPLESRPNSHHLISKIQ